MNTPAVEGTKLEHELAKFEQLGEVVIGAELEPGNLAVEPDCGEHENRHAGAYRGCIENWIQAGNTRPPSLEA